MKTRDKILRQLAMDKALLQNRFKVRRLGLFGSYARGDQDDGSDVDIIVDVDPSIGLDFVLLAEHVERSLGIHVDMVSLRAVSPRHMRYIEKEIIYV